MSEHQSAAEMRPPVGVWIWRSFDNPTEIVRRAREIGFDYLQIMVNAEPSRSKPDQPQSFSTSEIVALAEAAHDTSAGRNLDVGLTSWIVPSKAYIEAVAATLITLCTEVQATSLLWDAEGPWQDGTEMTHAAASELIVESFKDLTCPMGVTSSASLPDSVKILLERCPLGVPQAYSPLGGVEPGSGQTLYYPRWADVPGPNGSPRKVIMGLAAYQQATKHQSAAHNMQSAWNATIALAPQSICYWPDGMMAGNAPSEQVALTQLLGGSGPASQ